MTWNHNFKQYSDAPVPMPVAAIPMPVAAPGATPMPPVRPQSQPVAPYPPTRPDVMGSPGITGSASYDASPYGSIVQPSASTSGVTPFMAALAQSLMGPNQYAGASAPMTYSPGAGMLAMGPAGR